MRCPIIELRQYALRPGQRDVLIELFDREFVDPQEEAGMAILGQFRDLDRPDRFVWLRGFPDMHTRAEALRRFYGGSVWRAHRDEANATMLDVDDVLLLRPAAPHSGLHHEPAARPPVGSVASPPKSLVLATVYYRDRPFDEAFTEFFEGRVRPALVDSGATPLAWLQTEYAENNFPALPMRTGVNAFVWFASFGSTVSLAEHQHRLEYSQEWHEQVYPAISAIVAGPPQRLRLEPTARSLLGRTGDR